MSDLQRRVDRLERTIWGEKVPRLPTLYCSFCGKSQHEVRKLVAGPMAFICDECVKLCIEIVEEDAPKKEDAP